MVAGFRDAAEHLQRRYTETCNQLGTEPSPEIYDTEVLYRIIEDMLTSNELMIMMDNDFNQGLLVGRILDLLPVERPDEE
jgi:hypothetical protein